MEKMEEYKNIERMGKLGKMKTFVNANSAVNC